MIDGRVFTLKLPMRMEINKRGEVESLNLNIYRNLHFYSLNHQKKAFQDFVKPLLFGLPSMEAVMLHYEVNPKGGSRLDTMNVGSVVDKFFSDALVHNGIIPDDDYKHVVKNTFSFGYLCPKNPHVLVTITETQPRKETPMRILLDESEIQKALEAFVETMGLSGASGVELTINGNEIQAEIMMNGSSSRSTQSADSNTETTDQPVKRRGRLPGSKNKPKGDQDVAESTSTGSDLDSSGTTDSGEEEGSDNETETTSTVTKGKASDLFGESESSSDDEPDGPESTESTTGSKSNRGNLFGDLDEESSETTDPTDEEGSDSKQETQPVKSVKVSGKRPSIFDAD